MRSSIFDCELFDAAGYDGYRCDRSPPNMIFEKGGIVLIAIKSGPKNERMTISDTDGIEIISMRLYVEKNVHYVCYLYTSSGSLVTAYAAYNYAMSRF